MTTSNQPSKVSAAAPITIQHSVNSEKKSLFKKGCHATFWVVLMFAMIGLFVGLYDVNYTRPYIHEIFGTIIIAVVAVHVIRNRHFFSTVGRKNFPTTSPNLEPVSRYGNPYFILTDVINIFLIVSCVICLITGLLISKFVFKDIVAAIFNIENTRAIRPFHAMSSYLLLIAMGLHAGLHLNSLFNMIRNTLGKKWFRIIFGSMIVMAINGYSCLFEYNFISKFSLKVSKSIGTLHPDLYRVFYWTDLICIGVLFALISYGLAAYFNYRHMRESQ